MMDAATTRNWKSLVLQSSLWNSQYSRATVSSGLEPVPPNATVIFEVEAFSVSRGPRSLEAFGSMDVDNDKSLTKDEVPGIYWLFGHLRFST